MPKEKEDVKTAAPMNVTMRGTATEIREQAQVIAGEGNGEPKAGPPEENGIVAALRDPKNSVIVKRISPRKVGKLQTNCEVYRESCPLVLSEIAEEVARVHGGRKYRVSVINPKGEVEAAQTFDVDAEPLFEDSDAEDDALAREIMDAQGNGEKSSAEMSLESLDREARLSAKQFELEQARKRLKDLREESNPQRSRQDEESAARISKLERDVVETRYETKASALEKELADVRRQLAEPRGGADKTDKLLDLVMQQIKDSNEKFTKLIEQMNNQKLDQITKEISSLKNNPAGGPLALVKDLKDLKEVIGLFGGSGGDDEDDDDDPDKPWFERLADKYLPDVIDLIKDRGKEGKPMTKEEITKHIEEASKKAEDEAVAAAQKRIAASAPARLPGPAAPPVAVSPPGVPPAVAPPPPVAPPPTVEQDIAQRCGHVMTLFDRELALRVREWEWSYEWWGQLPETILEKAAVAADPAAMVDAFSGIFAPEAIDGLKKRLEEPKARAWAERGLRQLKEWHAKALVDPGFDPLDDEEETDAGK